MCNAGSAAEQFAEENGIDYVPASTTRPSTEPSTSPSVEPSTAAYALGDADLSGEVNIRDVTEIQKYIAQIVSFSSLQMQLADVDKNGTVNISDATTVQKYLARIIDLPE